jgi:hypothetical protein
MADEIRDDEQRLVEGVELLKATEGKIEPDAIPGELSVAHADYLQAHAVNLDVAAALGVRTITGRADTAELDDPWPTFATFPAILFPWTSPTGRVEIQVRPDNPTVDLNGRAKKYMFRVGMDPVLWAVRVVSGSERIVIVEGTKQCLAAASYAPPGVSIYGIAGCRMWQKDGVPIPDLAVAADHEVVILLDADAAGNLDVYQAGLGLAEALKMEGASKILFARLPGGGKAGLDDVLSTQPEERRAGYLARLIDNAKTKPAENKPTKKSKDQDRPNSADRTTLIVNNDRRTVINDLASALIDRWDGRELFNHGGVISRLENTRMVPLDHGTSRDIIQDTCITVKENNGAQGTTYTFEWPDANVISAVLSRASRFSPLERLAHAPFVRPDGTIVTEPGYDEATKTVLMSDPEMAGLTVPETPTPGEIQAARELLMNEWLGDFPLAEDVDRANLLALVVTPALRGLVPLAPMAVIDGLQMGVGKNLLADQILTVYTGQVARPMNWVDEPEELRKQITSAFRTGQEFFVFDEAHTLQGAPLAQALTASTWQDRILGVSNMAEFPNRVTWISLGNQVQVRGDITRRVYRISLRPTYDNPQDRPSHLFRHPGQSGMDLGAWTRKHRRDLLTAILTLVRAWFAAGQPYNRRGSSMGSFELWERYAGGVVETAGLRGFLDNIGAWRSESDFDSQYWVGHMAWLHGEFGDKPFRTSDVRTRALTDPAAYAAPPNLDDPSDKGYGKKLGEQYSRMKGRRYDGHYLDRVGWAHGHVTLWRVHVPGEADAPPAPPVAPEPEPWCFTCNGPGAHDHPEPTEPEPIEAAPPATQHVPARPTSDMLALDLEAGDADDLHKIGPGYVTLAGIASDENEVEIDGAYPAETAASAINGAKVTTGHNIMAFDLPALVHEGVLDMATVHEMAAAGRFADTLLMARYLDPPMAREKGVDFTRRYDLDSLAERLGLGRKDDAGKALAKKYGGWAKIPTDPDTEDGAAYRQYLHQDVNLSRQVYGVLLEEAGGTMPEYLVREHRVAAIAAQISLNGFRVDVPLLEERIAAINARKAESVAWLAAHAGLPLTDGRGKPYASPVGTKLGKERLEQALREAGATSIWRTEKSQALDISSDHMRHLASEYAHLPRVREIAQHVYRIVSSRSVFETVHNHLVGDRVHPKIGFDQATGRWSVTSPGLTVLGKRNGRHTERAVFLPEDGHVVMTADLSQVDMRAIAGLSQDMAYIEMLKSEDPHAEIALALFGDASLRDVAKPIGHGWNYGRGIKAISEGNELDPELVRRFDTSMRERFPRLVQWREEARELAASGALLDNGWGRKMRPDPQRAHTQGPALYGQGAARDIMMHGLLQLPSEVLPMLRAQIHDEIVLSVPIKDAPDVAKAVVEALSFEWRNVPITADTGPFGTDWSKCYEKG